LAQLITKSVIEITNLRHSSRIKENEIKTLRKEMIDLEGKKVAIQHG
jgi:hypothetical protein